MPPKIAEKLQLGLFMNSSLSVGSVRYTVSLKRTTNGTHKQHLCVRQREPKHVADTRKSGRRRTKRGPCAHTLNTHRSERKNAHALSSTPPHLTQSTNHRQTIIEATISSEEGRIRRIPWRLAFTTAWSEHVACALQNVTGASKAHTAVWLGAACLFRNHCGAKTSRLQLPCARSSVRWSTVEGNAFDSSVLW